MYRFGRDRARRYLISCRGERLICCRWLIQESGRRGAAKTSLTSIQSQTFADSTHCLGTATEDARRPAAWEVLSIGLQGFHCELAASNSFIHSCLMRPRSK